MMRFFILHILRPAEIFFGEAFSENKKWNIESLNFQPTM